MLSKTTYFYYMVNRDLQILPREQYILSKLYIILKNCELVILLGFRKK